MNKKAVRSFFFTPWWDLITKVSLRTGRGEGEGDGQGFGRTRRHGGRSKRFWAPTEPPASVSRNSILDLEEQRSWVTFLESHSVDGVEQGLEQTSGTLPWILTRWYFEQHGRSGWGKRSKFPHRRGPPLTLPGDVCYYHCYFVSSTNNASKELSPDSPLEYYSFKIKSVT